MKRWKLFRQIPPRLILIVTFVVVIINALMVGNYIHQNQTSQWREHRDDVIQQIMNVIHMTQATPNKNLSLAIEAIKEPNLKVTVSKQPQYRTQAHHLTFWSIYHLIPHRAKLIEISLFLAKQQWINARAVITPSAKWPMIVFLIFEVFVMLMILFYIWSINRFTQPLKAFQHAADRLGVELKSTRLKEYQGPAIVRQTAQAMNKMQQRIQDLLNDRTMMLAAISHDLRTPITRMKLRASKIKAPEIEAKMLADLDEMDTMIGEVLAFARNDQQEESLTKFELNSFLQTLCDDLTDVGYPLHYQSNSNRVPFRGRPLTLKRAFNNLIQNAIKYGKQADIQLSQSTEGIEITIDDQGQGIPEAELHKVFAPFYRVDRSRSRSVGGSGLGLTTAYDAIRAHHGSIELENRPTGGLRVKIRL